MPRDSGSCSHEQAAPFTKHMFRYAPYTAFSTARPLRRSKHHRHVYEHCRTSGDVLLGLHMLSRSRLPTNAVYW